MWEIVMEGPAVGKSIDPPHLHWTVYAYGLNGFAREHVVLRNPNVRGYPFPPNTRAGSSFSFCPSFFAKFLYLF